MDTAGIVLGIVTVLAIVIGPVAALWVQRILDEGRDKKNRKLWIFKTLMSNRATRLAPLYVQALNLIDVEFTEPKEKAIREAWKELLDLYTNFKTTPNAVEHVGELTATLLAEMAKVLGYDFDKVYLKKGVYYPEFLGNVEVEQHALRRAVLELLAGKRRIPVGVLEDKFPEINLPDLGIAELDAMEPKKLNR
jgi:hypothetical protein